MEQALLKLAGGALYHEMIPLLHRRWRYGSSTKAKGIVLEIISWRILFEFSSLALEWINSS